MAANTPARAAAAVAHPFHMESSPTRVCPKAMLGVTASEMASRVCSRGSRIRFAAAQAEPSAASTPWSQPSSPKGIWSAMEQKA